MQSKTSFFNATLYRQSLRLAAPVGLGMLITWLIIFPLSLFNRLYSGYNAWDSQEQLHRIIWYNIDGAFDAATMTALIFGGVLAVTLFHYLNTSRSVNMFHALPLRREGLFLTQYAVGVTYITLSLLITAPVVLALQASVGMMAVAPVLSWMWMTWVVTLFFFSFALWTMMFAGVTWAGVVYYGIFNAVVMVLYNMYTALAQNFFYGLRSMSTPAWVDWCTPVTNLSGKFGLTNINEAPYYVQGQGRVLGYGLAGIVLVVIALVIYRRRPSESASDVVAIGWAKPLFRFGMALCSGLIFGLGLYSLAWQNFRTVSYAQKLIFAVTSMILVGIVGLIVAEMLMEKSMRIGKRWLMPALAVAAFFIAVGGSIDFDVFGIEGYVPEENQVSMVEISVSGRQMSTEALLDDPDDIAQVLTLHRNILAETDRQMEMDEKDQGDGWMWVSLTYYDEEEHVFARRSYDVRYYREDVAQPTPLMAALSSLLDEDALRYGVLGAGYDDDDIRIEHVELSLYDQDGRYQVSTGFDDYETGRRIYDALRQDLEEENLALWVLEEERDGIHYRHSLELELVDRETGNHDYLGIPLWPQMTHTLALLEELDAFGDYPPVLEIDDKVLKK